MPAALLVHCRPDRYAADKDGQPYLEHGRATAEGVTAGDAGAIAQILWRFLVFRSPIFASAPFIRLIFRNPARRRRRGGDKTTALPICGRFVARVPVGRRAEVAGSRPIPEAPKWDLLISI